MMSGDFILILTDDDAELQDGDANTVWHSDDDSAFGYSPDMDDDEIIAHLVRKEIIVEDDDVSEIVDERADADDDDDADDDEDDDADDDEDD